MLPSLVEKAKKNKGKKPNKEIGYEGWRDKYKYGKRWINETTFSRAKREYGEYVTAVKWKKHSK